MTTVRYVTACVNALVTLSVQISAATADSPSPRDCLWLGRTLRNGGVACLSAKVYLRTGRRI